MLGISYFYHPILLHYTQLKRTTQQVSFCEKSFKTTQHVGPTQQEVPNNDFWTATQKVSFRGYVCVCVCVCLGLYTFKAHKTHEV